MSSRKKCHSCSRPKQVMDEASRRHQSDTEGMSSRRRNCGCNQVRSGDCSRFCSNVCRRLFPFSFNQCFNDCISCQED